MAQSIKELGISPKPFMSVYYPERSVILPSGTVIEQRVRPLNGYIGEVYDATHSIEYPNLNSIQNENQPFDKKG